MAANFTLKVHFQIQHNPTFTLYIFKHEQELCYCQTARDKILQMESSVTAYGYQVTNSHQSRDNGKRASYLLWLHGESVEIIEEWMAAKGFLNKLKALHTNGPYCLIKLFSAW